MSSGKSISDFFENIVDALEEQFPEAKSNHEVQECKRLLRLQYQAMASFKQLAEPLEAELDKLDGFPELQDSDDVLLLRQQLQEYHAEIAQCKSNISGLEKKIQRLQTGASIATGTTDEFEAIESPLQRVRNNIDLLEHESKLFDDSSSRTPQPKPRLSGREKALLELERLKKARQSPNVVSQDDGEPDVPKKRTL